MKLKVVKSGSKGNCYLLTARNGETLVIEAGVPFKTVQQALGFDTRSVVAVLVSHEHKDHAAGVPELIERRLPVYASQGTLDAIFDGRPDLKEATSVFHAVRVGEPFPLWDFKVIAYRAQHDAAEPLYFEIYHDEMGKLLFMTDTVTPQRVAMMLANGIKTDYQHILIEANYRDYMLADDGKLPETVKERIAANHLSDAEALEVLGAVDLNKTLDILLVHLSEAHSDAEDFVREFEEATGVRTRAALPGVEYDINDTPF